MTILSRKSRGNSDANANLEKCIQTYWEFIRNKRENFKIVDGKLLAGRYVVNGNFEVPDKVQKILGPHVRIMVD